MLERIEWSKLYESWGVTTDALERAYSPARLLEILVRFLPSNATARVLELGCAPGRWLGWARTRLGVTGIGIELDQRGAELTKQLYKFLLLIRGDAACLPLADECCDATFSIGLLEHFDDPRPILLESGRVLRDRGICITAMPNIAAGTFHRWHWETFQKRFLAAHHPYTLAELEQTVSSAGFEIIHAEHNGIYIPHLQRVMGRLPFRGLLRRLEHPLMAANLVVVAQKRG